MTGRPMSGVPRALHPERTHLLLTAHNFGPAFGGIERLADGLARHVAPGTTTVLAASTGSGPAAPQATETFDAMLPYPVARRRMVGASPPRWLAARRAVQAELRRPGSHYDAVLALEWWPEARALGSITHRPTTAVVVHGTELARSLGRPRARRSMERALQSADAVVAVSAFTAELAAMVGVAATVVHPGVELDPPAHDSAALAADLDVTGRPVVLTAARLIARKGHADLLGKWPEIVRQVPDAVWLVVGDGPERARLHRSSPPSVRWLGHVDDHTLAALYRLADVHVLPGRELGGAVEGFGMAAVEAGAAGTPTVATDVGGTAEAVGAGGIVVPPGDPGRLADTIVGLLQDDRTRAMLGQRARQRAESLAWPLVGDQVRTVLGLARESDDIIDAVARTAAG